MTRQEKIKLLKLKREKLRRKAKEELTSFSRFVDDDFTTGDFHKKYYKILNMFAEGLIPKLIVTVPPQHGKSEGTSRKLPPYILGKNPDKKIGLASYNQTFVRGFARDIKRTITSKEYKKIFPKTRIKESGFKDLDENGETNTADLFETVGRKGFCKFVGRGAGVTGTTLDMAILDDIFKGYSEASSPLIRDAAWNWYVTEIRSRLHNTSQQLITFTRWDNDDLIGRIEKVETVIVATCWADLENIPRGAWVKINFQAVKDGDKTEIDPREQDDPLWEERHNYEKLMEDKALNPNTFEALYQGNPTPKEGFLYDVERWPTYNQLPSSEDRCNYTDTADLGKDKLCSVCYIHENNKAYVTDIYYTADGMEITEPATATMLTDNNTKKADIESNNGGRGFARNVDGQTDASVAVTWFHQSGNKESRILTNSVSVNTNIIMPSDWKTRFKEFYTDLEGYKKDFKSNKHDDAPDCLTGIIEKLCIPPVETWSQDF